jgi:hypothetical protein
MITNQGRPNIQGIWEWFKEDGTRRLVCVYNVGIPLKEVRLRVKWWGGYYDVRDSVEDTYYCDGSVAKKDVRRSAEWPDRWGEYVGRLGSVKDEDLYLMPTTEQRTEIMKQYEQSKLATDTQS